MGGGVRTPPPPHLGSPVIMPVKLIIWVLEKVEGPWRPPHPVSALYVHVIRQCTCMYNIRGFVVEYLYKLFYLFIYSQVYIYLSFFSLFINHIYLLYQIICLILWPIFNLSTQLIKIYVIESVKIPTLYTTHPITLKINALLLLFSFISWEVRIQSVVYWF